MKSNAGGGRIDTERQAKTILRDQITPAADLPDAAESNAARGRAGVTKPAGRRSRMPRRWRAEW